jgi:hypothetical protein
MRWAGTPVDALGVQGHLDVGGDPFSPAKFRRFLAEVAALELDSKSPSSISRRLPNSLDTITEPK